MPAGTIKLTNNSTSVTGTGTSFTTELTANDFLVAVSGGVTYTLAVSSVDSDTMLTLNTAYNGPTTTGLAWTPVPNATLVGITAQVAADVAKAIRGMNLDKANWQQIFSGAGNVTVTLPDGTSWTGPAWRSVADLIAEKADKTALDDKADKTALNDYAKKGDNNDITSLAGLTTAISVEQGGTGANSAEDAVKNLGLGTAALENKQTSKTDTNGLLINGAWGLGSGGVDTISWGDTARQQKSMFVSSSVESPVTDMLFLGLNCSHGSNAGYATQIASRGSYGLYHRTRENTVFNAWRRVYDDGNTTRAADGTLKAASPVARIVKSQEENQRTDVNEMDFEWCGAGTRNSEAAGITITRMDTGVYALTGSLGLAKEGWQLSPPRDPMGSGDMGIVEAEETESGGITVRLYKRKYMLSDDGEIVLTKGPLIDVPPTSWIDIRLQMPEKSTQPETEAERAE